MIKLLSGISGLKNLKNKILVFTASFFLLCATHTGIFYLGKFQGKTIQKAEDNEKIAKLESENRGLIIRYEEERNKIKEKIVVEYVDRIKVVERIKYVNQRIIEENVPTQFELSNGWVHSHDSAATSVEADPTRSSDAAPSGVTDNQALSVINDNYSTCNETREQLIKLQEYILEEQKLADQFNKEQEELAQKKKRWWSLWSKK